MPLKQSNAKTCAMSQKIVSVGSELPGEGKMDHPGFSCRKESRVRLGLPNAPCAIGRSGIVHLVPSIGSRKFGNHAEGSRIRPSRRMFGQRRPPHPRRLTKWARMFMTASQESADPSSSWLLGNARKRRNVSRESLADAMNMRVPHLKLSGSTGRPRQLFSLLRKQKS